MEGPQEGSPLAETAGAGGPALQQHPWPGRALLLLPSGLPPGPWWLHPTRTSQQGRGPATHLGSPSKEEESCCVSPARGAHLVRLEEPGFGSTILPPHGCFFKDCLLVFWGSSSSHFKWEGFREPQMKMTKVLACLPCSSSSTWFSAPTAAEKRQLETEPRGLGSITRHTYMYSELIFLLSQQASLLKDINTCLPGVTNCLRHFRNSGPSLLVRI